MSIAQARRAVELALAELADAKLKLEGIEHLQNELIADITNRYLPEVRDYQAAIERMEFRLVTLWLTHGEHLRDSDDSATATLNNGVLRERKGPIAVELGKKELVLQYLQDLGEVDRFTTQPEPEVSKTLLKNDPVIVDQAPDHIMYFVRGRTLYAQPKGSSAAFRYELGRQIVRPTEHSS
jgi:phage host-nuclease inhibitor protein Gam